MSATCEDCPRVYGEPGFPDLIIPYDAWKRISPKGDDSGLLCPSCICARLEKAGIRCEGALMSGPITSVSAVEMSNLRRVENIELAIEGRGNRGSGVRKLIDDKPQSPAKGEQATLPATDDAELVKRLRRRADQERIGSLGWQQDQICVEAADRITALSASRDTAGLVKALEKSLELQSHYAQLLNEYDGGHRLQFMSADEWLARLHETALASHAKEGK